MIDVHSHVIFGVDDGPKTIEESVHMISEASKAGVKIIIATPHYQKEKLELQSIIDNYQRLIKKIKELDVTVLLGYEVHINPCLPDLLAQSNILTMNGSGYLLLELPFDLIPIYAFDVIYKLQMINITTVIAHPERNGYFIKDFDKFLNFVERGCLIQMDAASILGKYGRKVREFTKKVIKLNLAHFVASDAHSAKDYAERYQEAYSIAKRWAGEDYADKLFTKNATIIIENKKESIYEMI